MTTSTSNRFGACATGDRLGVVKVGDIIREAADAEIKYWASQKWIKRSSPTRFTDNKPIYTVTSKGVSVYTHPIRPKRSK